MKVYTGKGDSGNTGLFYGGRIGKDALRVDTYGTVDEAVAALGLARAQISGHERQQLSDLILSLQRQLFVVGAELATAPDNHERLVAGETRVDANMCTQLGDLISHYEQDLPELREFVIPGGDPLSAALDFARTVIRRAERLAVELHSAGELASLELLTYLNRLGDLIFLLARDVEGAAHRSLLH